MRAIDPDVLRLIDEFEAGVRSRSRILAILERLEALGEPRAVPALAGFVLSERGLEERPVTILADH